MKKYILPTLMIISVLSFKGGDVIKAYVAFKPANQGIIFGTSGKEKEGWFAASDFDLAGITPVHVGEMPANLKFNPTTITKNVDAASPDLAKAFKNKTPFDFIKLQVPAPKQGDKMYSWQKAGEVSTITFSTATITSLSTSGSTETLKISYKSMVTDSK